MPRAHITVRSPHLTAELQHPPPFTTRYGPSDLRGDGHDRALLPSSSSATSRRIMKAYGHDASWSTTSHVREIGALDVEIGRSRGSLLFPKWFAAGWKRVRWRCSNVGNSKWSFGAILELFGVNIATLGNSLLTLLMGFWGFHRLPHEMYLKRA